MNMELSMQSERVQDGVPLEQLFVNGKGEHVHPVNSIILIVQKNVTNIWTPLGTGFFISPNGLFVTAKHVLVDNDGKLLDSLAALQIFRREEKTLVRDIVQVDLHPYEKNDVAIGLLKNNNQSPILNDALFITDRDPQKNERIATYSIPKPAAIDLNDGKFEIQFAPRIIWGEIEEHYPLGRDDSGTFGNCFQTSIHLEGGCSGGPVFLSDGSVFGINSKGFAFPVSFISSITNIFDLKINNVILDSPSNYRSSISIREMAEEGIIQLDKSK